MNAEQFLNEALGGNMNISTLKPLAWHEIMESYAQHKIKEVAHSASDNTTNSAIALCIRKWIDEHGLYYIDDTMIQLLMRRLEKIAQQH